MMTRGVVGVNQRTGIMPCLLYRCAGWREIQIFVGETAEMPTVHHTPPISAIGQEPRHAHRRRPRQFGIQRHRNIFTTPPKL